MKRTLTLILFLFSRVCFAQNLVPNPSFEDTVHCPFGAAHIDDALGWYHAGNSADYFNPCANAFGPTNGVPINFTGSQFAYDGNSYAGLVTYIVYFQQGYREKMGVQLSQPLSIGIKYYVSAYISRGDTIFGSDTIKCSANKFGFRFSLLPHNNSANYLPTDNFSQVHSDSIVTDAVNWTKIAGSFIADSTYQYLFIGNFYDDAHTDTAQCSGGYAYYLVDMVCVSTDSLTCNLNVGINQVKNTLIKIFPDPVTDVLNIEHSFPDTKFELFNISGELIADGMLNRETNKINLTSIANGIYFLRLNKIHSYKIIIMH
jgi:hypothetical protein